MSDGSMVAKVATFWTARTAASTIILPLIDLV